MDPNETLRRLRLACDEASTTGADPEEQRLHAVEAVELFLALDDWLSRGGTLPVPWAEAPEYVI